MFEVDFTSEEWAKRALEVINNAKVSWVDPEAGDTSVVWAQTDKSPKINV